MLSILAVSIFTILLISQAYAVQWHTKADKFRVGFNFIPFTHCTIWTNNGIDYRQVSYSFTELVDAAILESGNNVLDSLNKLDTLPNGGTFTTEEQTLCLELYNIEKNL